MKNTNRNFIEIKRAHPVYRPLQARIRDFVPVECPPEIPEVQTQASRCMDCGIPFCHALGCPLGNVIPEMNAAAEAGNWRVAWDILRATSPFPEFTSRLCPALCEAACTAGLDGEAVTIRATEQAITLEAYRRGFIKPRPVPGRIGKSVAVIGSGPAGLAAADLLNQAGWDVTVYEKSASPGGLLRYGIPDFKLDKLIVERRIRLLLAEGIHFTCNTEIGIDLSASYLKKHFNAVILALGTPTPRDLPIPGRELSGIHFALDFLTAQNRLIAEESAALPITAKGKNVLVIGGGDTGSDCIGTARRQGAKSITQIELLPEPPTSRSPSTPWPEYPYLKRTSSSQEEGVERIWSIQSNAFIGEKGKVTALEAARLAWKFSPDGRPLQSVPEKNGALKIPAELVLLAMGFTGVSSSLPILQQLGLCIDERGRIQTDAGGCAAPGIYIAGDAATGQSLVVRAIAHARHVARTLHTAEKLASRPTP